MSTPMQTIPFGPPHAQWLYSRATATYDLSRARKERITMCTTQGPAAAITVAPQLGCLVIVDMQNFFLSERCRDHPLGIAAVEPTIRVIEKCREVGIQVVWLNWGLDEQSMSSMPAGVQRGFSRAMIADVALTGRAGLGADLGDGKGRCLFSGSWNADIYAPLKKHVRAEDIHCAKTRMSGLWDKEQPLWRYLDGQNGHKKESIFFTGVNTDQCVLGTLTDAYNAGWDCVMIEDCCATTTEWGKGVCTHNVSGSYGFVVDSQTFCAAKTT